MPRWIMSELRLIEEELVSAGSTDGIFRKGGGGVRGR